MTLLTSDQKGKQRADGHKSQFYLSVCQPAVLLTASINEASPVRGQVAIDYDNGVSAGLGLISRIREGVSVKIIIDNLVYYSRLKGFSVGSSSPTLTGSISVDNNSIPWEDNATIEVFEFFEPRIIQPTFDSSTGISTKRGLTFDPELTLDPRPVAKLGIHRAAFLEGASVVFDLDGSGIPVDTGVTITTYLWECTGGTIGSAGSASTTLTISAPGQYWLFLTVTDSNGKTHTGMRHIWVHSTDPEDTTYPYTDFSPPNISISLDGGMRTSLTVNGVAGQAEFIDGALVVLWAENWYGESKETISLIPEDYGLLFTGYIVKDSIQYDSEHGTVTFEAHSIIDVMKALSMQALSIHAENEVTYWFQMGPKMTVTKMLQWLLYWHSTLLDVTDWEFPDSSLYKKLFKFNEGGLYNQVKDIASKLPAVLACDKAGRVFVEMSLQHKDDADRAAAEVVSEITTGDWRAEVVIVRKARKDVSMTYLSGFFYDGGGYLVIPYCSLAPTKIREGQGSGKGNLDGMILEDQAHANRLSGRFHALANSEIEEVRIKFAGNYSVLDVVPQRWWTLTLTGEDNPRGVSFTDLRLLPKVVSIQPEPENGVTLVEAVFEPETFGPDGVHTLCPSEGAVAAGGGEQQPDWTPGPGAVTTGPPALLSFASAKRLDEGAESWRVIDDTSALYSGAVDPFWPVKTRSVNPERALGLVGKLGGLYSVQWARDPISLLPGTNPPNTWSESPAPTAPDLYYIKIVPDPFTQGWYYILAYLQNGSNEWRSWAAVTTNDGASWTWAELYDGSLPDEIRPLGMAVNQDYVLITVWDSSSGGTLKLLVYDKALVYQEEHSLGDATLSEIDAGTYHAFPVTVIDDPELWYVAGRMQAPQGLGDPTHIVQIIGAGVSWSAFEFGWGDKRCLAFEVKAAVDFERAYYALKG